MNYTRRTLLKGTLAGGMVAVAVGAGLLTPRTVLAAWPKAAFDAPDIKSVLQTMAGSTDSTPSTEIRIKAPDIAENGSVVPITVSTKLDQLESISIMAKENARPLAVTYQMSDGVAGYVSTRIKMGKTSDVIAVVKSGGKLYSAKKSVKVTLGGCGG